jgi:UDP-GlcNAc3NAcA epimerase
MLAHQLSHETYQAVVHKDRIKIIPPAGFLDIIALEKNASMIITDSGGLQKEAFFFKKPCIILREQTEWVEIVANGNAILVGASEDRILDAYDKLSEGETLTFPEIYGDGHSAEFICQKILDEL